MMMAAGPRSPTMLTELLIGLDGLVLWCGVREKVLRAISGSWALVKNRTDSAGEQKRVL